MFMPVVAALYWKRCGKIAVFGSIIVSQLLSIGLPWDSSSINAFWDAARPFWAMVGGFITLVVLAFITPNDRIKNLQKTSSQHLCQNQPITPRDANPPHKGYRKT